MSGYSFLLMLGTFAFVVYWYCMNHERDEDGKEGLLGIEPQDVETIKKKRLLPGYALLRLRGKLPEESKRPLDSLDSVRQKADAIKDQQPPTLIKPPSRDKDDADEQSD